MHDWDSRYKNGIAIPSQPFSDVVAELHYVNKQLKRSDKRVFDLGCGIGNHYSVLCELGFNYFGIDASAHAIEIAKRKYSSAPNNSFMQQEFRDINSAVNTYDLVLDRHSSDQLVEISDFKNLIASLERILKPGGFYVAVFFLKSENSKLREGIGSRLRFSKKEITELMRNFEVRRMTFVSRRDGLSGKIIEEEMVITLQLDSDK